MPPLLGFHCSHEQHAPSALLRHVTRAADAGFTAAMCSDHLAPWSLRQGQSGYAWSWLGAALQATNLSFGTVCAPGQRYHPVIIAQAAATLAEMYPDRFWVSLGSGEALNEAMTGGPWPSKADRNARLRECVEVMRALWRGETVSLESHVTVRDARLYVAAPRPPLVVGAGLTPETARWLGEWADALVTVSGPRESMRRIIEAFRERGAGKPIFLQVSLAFAPTDAEAEAAAMDQWRHCAVGTEMLADLRSPEAFDRESAEASPADVLTKVRASSDVERQVAWLEEDAALGFDRIYLHNVAREHQERFIDTWGERVLPRFHGR